MKSILMLLTFMTVSAAHAISPEEILKKADRIRSLQYAHSLKCVVEATGEADAPKSIFKVSVKNADISLVEQLSPERLKGRKVLLNGENLWMTTPNIKRPTRVSLEQRLTGQVANGDLVRAQFANDYSSTLEGEEKVRGKNVYKLKLVAKTKNVTYAQIEYFVEKNTYYPIEAHFFAISGKLLKTAVYSDFKKILGNPLVTKIFIQDAIQKQNQSLVIFSNFKKENFGDSYFDKEALNQ